MKESRLTAQIMSYARKYGCFVVKWHMTAYGSGGMPDVYILVPLEPYAIPVHIEVKTPGNTPTPRQSKVLRDLRKGGAVSFWTDAFSDVEYCIERLQAGYGVKVNNASGRLERAREAYMPICRECKIPREDGTSL